jgi:hypothetical protein
MLRIIQSLLSSSVYRYDLRHHSSSTVLCASGYPDSVDIIASAHFNRLGEAPKH